MSNNKQSSIDWLVEILGKYNEEMVFLYQNEIEQAKAMHKEEKIKFATDFFFWWYNQTSGTNTVEAVEQYYNETFGGNK